MGGVCSLTIKVELADIDRADELAVGWDRDGGVVVIGICRWLVGVTAEQAGEPLEEVGRLTCTIGSDGYKAIGRWHDRHADTGGGVEAKGHQGALARVDVTVWNIDGC